MSPRDLDETDEQLLAELTRNARVSLVVLGEKVHLSRNAVRQRIKRMESDGVISGYTVVRGRMSSGKQPTRATLFLYRTHRMRDDRVLTILQSMAEVVRCEILSGDFDLLVTVEAESTDRILELWKKLAALPDVENIITSLTLATLVDR